MNNLFDNIPSYQGGTDNEYFNCNNGSSMLRISNTTKKEYDNYQELLHSAGFSLYDSHRIRDNYYATYISSTLLVQIYYTSHDCTTRIIADPNTNLYRREQDVTCPKLFDTTLYQMELDYRMIDCGMCYITQCSDGSFFIIDSAHMDSVNDHQRLHDLLRRLTPQGKEITISGWFFSHAHQDHIVMFMEFIKAGFNDYKIECLYYNFPALTIPGSEKWKETDKQTIREFDALIEEHKELPVIKLHTGQRFFIRNLEFEVLATHEDIYPGYLARFNDSSTILLMTVEGCKTLFLGDANVAECTIVVSRYGSYVKSDIVQVAHHGYNASNVGIYFCADPKVALYSTKQNKFDENLHSESNSKVTELCKEIFIAGNGTAALKLPYTPGTAVVFPKEIND
jgi:beta-lactamase superfamily II metal-dependent hydrolase